MYVGHICPTYTREMTLRRSLNAGMTVNTPVWRGQQPLWGDIFNNYAKAGGRTSRPGGVLTESSEYYIVNQMVNH